MARYEAETADATAFEFVIEREFAAPRALLFEIWTDCQHLRQWFSPKGFGRLQCSNDLRPGGMLHYQLQTPAGLEFWGRWLYREIDPPQRLEFITGFSDETGGIVRNPWQQEWPLQMLSVVEFTERAGKTMVTVRATVYEATAEEAAAFAAGAPSMTQGWGGTFENLEAYLAELAA